MYRVHIRTVDGLPNTKSQKGELNMAATLKSCSQADVIQNWNPKSKNYV